MERKTGKEYSDKFQIRVVSLKHIENAEDKENPNGLYKWAKLFAATNWEEVKTIVENNDYMKSVASGIQVLTEDEKVRLAVEARAKALSDMTSRYDRGVDAGAVAKEKELMPIIDQKDAVISEQAEEIAQLKTLLANAKGNAFL